MKNLKFGKRIVLAYGTILVLFIIVSIISLVSLKKSNDKFVNFYNKGHEVTINALDMRRDLQSVAKNVGYATMSLDLKTSGTYIDAAEADLKKFQEGIQFIRENYDGDQSLIDSIEKSLNEVQPNKEQVFELARDNKTRQAADLFFESVNPGFEKIQTGLIQFSNLVSESADKDYQKAQNTVVATRVVIILLQILAIAAAILMAIFMTKSIVEPMKEIEKAASDMSKGSLHVSLDYNSNNELGILADRMRATISNIGNIIDDIGNVLGAIADGNFQVGSKNREQYVLDYNPILLAMRKIRNNLSDALSQINQSADLVANGSEQVSSAAQSLSQGATEQASSIQELAATINDISNQISSNAQSAKNLRTESEETGINVQRSNEKMSEMNQAMEEISEKSNEIGKIIRAIEDIAFQTNILALNAAVEAARAGEAGKGFAVVADEVRNLASKSGEAAKNTTLLIEQSMQAVDNGTRITAETSKAMQEVVDGSQRINSIIEEISEASEKQAIAVEQVTQGIDQISSVVQTNSATAEQSAAASEELSGQAQIMKGLVQQFTLYTGELEENEDADYGQIQPLAESEPEENLKTQPDMQPESFEPEEQFYKEEPESPAIEIEPESPAIEVEPEYFEEPPVFDNRKY